MFLVKLIRNSCSSVRDWGETSVLDRDLLFRGSLRVQLSHFDGLAQNIEGMSHFDRGSSHIDYGSRNGPNGPTTRTQSHPIEVLPSLFHFHLFATLVVVLVQHVLTAIHPVTNNLLGDIFGQEVGDVPASNRVGTNT